MKKSILCTILYLIYATLDGSQNSLHITIVGTGYVGLVTGSGLAELGNQVTCADINKYKIEALQAGIIPIYEHNLASLVHRNVDAQRLKFTSDIPTALQDADVIFIAVGTPQADDGAADLSAVELVIQSIGSSISKHKTIVTKSTVPIGTGAWIRTTLENTYGIPGDMFTIVSNPEFLREGNAVADFMIPDRLVIGTESDDARATMHTIYKKLIDDDKIPVVWTTIVTAETIKYAANGFLALKISFINEMANMCDASGADVLDVAYGMGLDSRIGGRFLRPGPGFGGSCFPKDSSALIYMAHKYVLPLHTVQAALTANEVQKEIPVKKLYSLLNNKIEGKTVAILGLAFKADTDDIRSSPALTTLRLLTEQHAHVQAYDPAAMDNMRPVFPDIRYCASMYEALDGADAAVIITEWDEFKHIDFNKAKRIMKNPIIVDARNILNTTKMAKHGFTFDTIGRSYLSHT